MRTRLIDVSPVRLVVILAATLLVLSAATWFVLILPKQSTANSLDATIKTTQTQLAKLVQSENPKSASHRHALSQSVLTTRALPNLAAMPQIVLQLSRIATEVHVSLDSITPQAPVAYAGYEAVPITVTLYGEFFGVQGFLQELRNQVRVTSDGVAAHGRLYDVLGVTFQSTTPAPKVTATLTLDAFYYTGIGLPPLPGSGSTTTPAS